MTKYRIIGSSSGTVHSIRTRLDTPSEDLLTNHEKIINELANAASEFAAYYKQLADSGDCGNWRAEDEPEYMRLMNILNPIK